MNFLLEHKQKLRKPLKAYKDSSAKSAKEMALGISLLPSSSHCCLAFGWHRCCQNFLWAGGRLGRWEGHVRPNRKLATLIRPPNHWQVWDKSTRQAGQARHGSWLLVPSANMSALLSLATNPVRGILLTALERGQSQLREVKYHAWGPRLVSTELWLKSRSVRHPGPRSFHYTLLGCWVSVIGEFVNGLKFSFTADFLSQSYKNEISSKTVPTWVSFLQILGQKGGRALQNPLKLHSR